MSEKLSPEALYKFFQSLDPGDAAVDEGEEEIHYGSPTLLRRALAAAKMLVEIQEILGVKEAPAVLKKAEVKDLPKENAEMKATKDALAEAESEVDRLLLQNVELKKDNESLKERVRRLQRQVERLYNKSELASLLGRLEPGQEERAPKPADKKILEEESASRAPKEEKAADGAGEETTNKIPAEAASGESKADEAEIEDVDKEIAELADASRIPPEEREREEREKREAQAAAEQQKKD